MSKLFYAIMAGFALACALAFASAAHANDDEKLETYALKKYAHREFSTHIMAVFTDPIDGECLIRWMTEADDYNRVFSVIPFTDTRSSLSSVELKIMNKNERITTLEGGDIDPNKMALAIDNGSAMRIRSAHIDSTQRVFSMVLDHEHNAAFRKQFETGKSLHLNIPGVYIGSMSLHGSKWAVEQQRACTKELEKASKLKAPTKLEPKPEV